MTPQIMQLLQNPQMFQQKFNEFMKNFQQNSNGISAQQMVQNLLNQGKMTQTQFNNFREIANSLTGMKY